MLKKLKKELQKRYQDRKKSFYIGPARLLYAKHPIDNYGQITNCHLVFENANNKLVIISSKPRDEYQIVLDPNSPSFYNKIDTLVSRFFEIECVPNE